MAGISPDGVLIVTVQATPERGSISLKSSAAAPIKCKCIYLLSGLIMTERNCNALRRHKEL